MMWINQAKTILQLLMKVRDLKKMYSDYQTHAINRINRLEREIVRLEEHIHALHINNDLDTEKNVGY